MMLGTVQLQATGTRRRCSGQDRRRARLAQGRRRPADRAAPTTWTCPAASKICAPGRVMREQAGVLTGYALGRGRRRSPPGRSPPTCWRCSAPTPSCAPRRSPPGSRSGSPRPTPTSPRPRSRASCAALGVTVKNVREPGQAPAQGCERTRGRGGHVVKTVTNVLQPLTSGNADRDNSGNARLAPLTCAVTA